MYQKPTQRSVSGNSFFIFYLGYGQRFKFPRIIAQTTLSSYPTVFGFTGRDSFKKKVKKTITYDNNMIG